MIIDKLENLREIYELLENSDVLKGMPEIEAALRIIYGALYVRKYDESKVLLEIIDWFDLKDVPIYDDFMEEEYSDLKGIEHHEMMEIFMTADHNFLRECSEFMHYPNDCQKASKEQLSDYLSNALLSDRDYDYYEDEIRFRYSIMIENALIEYKDTVYDSEKLQFWCYDEKFISELWIYNGASLMRYCGNDLEKLAMIYREEYGEVYYEGTLEELPADIQLYIRLTD